MLFEDSFKSALVRCHCTGLKTFVSRVNISNPQKRRLLPQRRSIQKKKVRRTREDVSKQLVRAKEKTADALRDLPKRDYTEQMYRSHTLCTYQFEPVY